MKSLMISSKPVFGADVVRIANVIAADSDTIAFGVFFWGEYLAKNFGVGYVLTYIQWGAIVVDNKEGVGAQDAFSRSRGIGANALEEATEFIGIVFVPKILILCKFVELPVF